LRGVRGARCGHFSPDMRMTYAEGSIGNISDGRTQLICIDGEAACRKQLLVALSVIPLAHRFDADVSPHCIQTEQQADLTSRLIQDFACGRTVKMFEEADTQSGFFQDLQQRRCAPASPDFGLELPKILWLWLGFERGEMNPASLFWQEAYPVTDLWQCTIKG